MPPACLNTTRVNRNHIFMCGSPKANHIKSVSNIFRVFLSTCFAFSLCGISSDLCFPGGGRGIFRICRIFPVSGSNRWFRKPDQPALFWLALGDRDHVYARGGEKHMAGLPSCDLGMAKELACCRHRLLEMDRWLSGAPMLARHPQSHHKYSYRPSP